MNKKNVTINRNEITGQKIPSQSTDQVQNDKKDDLWEGRDEYFMDIDRMINEGLGGGQISTHNGLIEESTTDTMDHVESSFGNNT